MNIIFVALYYVLATIVIGEASSPAIAKVLQQQQQQQPQPQLASWQAIFTPNKLEVHMDTQVHVLLELMNVDISNDHHRYELQSQNPELASVEQIIYAHDIDAGTASWRGNITISAHFIGQTQIYVQLYDTSTNSSNDRSNETLQMTIIRKQRVIDHIFTGSVALLVSLLYVNFGAALDLSVLRALVRRPVGPSIGFVTQFLLMPLLSYALGYAIFRQQVELQLGLFFTGVSPSGGASNIWTVILGGNINLSVLMTTISNFAAFGMMPLWIFSLGRWIFDRGNIQVPYTNIATFAVALVVPLGIGIAIQKCSPRITAALVRLLRPISACLIIFIIIFAIATNLYLFQLFSWQIVLSGLGLPWLGYVFGWILAKVLRQTNVDALTIAIETGIQNTGIAIFLLRFSLPQPQADLTTVIPVAVAIMTPLPLLALFIYRRYAERNIKDGIIASDVQSITEANS